MEKSPIYKTTAAGRLPLGRVQATLDAHGTLKDVVVTVDGKPVCGIAATSIEMTTGPRQTGQIRLALAASPLAARIKVEEEEV